MRRVAALFVAPVFILLAAACGDDGDSAPENTVPSETSAAPASSFTTTAPGTIAPGTSGSTPSVDETPLVALEPDGLGIVDAGSGSTTHLSFGTDGVTVRDAVAAALGDPTDEGLQEDCPPGPADISRYEDSLSLTFQDDDFVGWTVSHDSVLTTVAGVGLGTTVEDLESTYAGVTFEQTTLGIEFTAGDLHGTIDDSGDDDGVIDAMWAGTTCIFR